MGTPPSPAPFCFAEIIKRRSAMAKNTGTNLTMAGLRQEEEKMRAAAQAQQQKPLTAITVALAQKETKAPTMAGLRQAEQRMAPNMTMGGLRLAEKNEAGLRTAQQTLAQIQNERETSENKIGNAIRTATDVGKGIYSAGKFGQYRLYDYVDDTSVFGIVDSTLGRVKNGKPVGDWYLRIDNPHRGYQYPHANINPKAIFDKDPHIPISSNTVKFAQNADKSLKIAKAGGKALAVVGLAIDAYDVATAVSADLTDADQRLGKKTASAASSAALSWAVAAAGAEAFAIGGAAIGTLIMPGVGTAIGGLIGGVVGGILGAASGREMSGWIMDEIQWGE